MGNKKGFTLIELLVVIGILAILLAITLIAVNPGEQLERSEDTQRRADINSTLNAINQYMIDNNGQPPAGVGASATPISSAGTGAVFCTSLVPQYIASLPQDPNQNGDGVDETECAGAYATGYRVLVTSNNRVTVEATDADGNTMSVTR